MSAVDPALEAPRDLKEPGFSDAVTVCFGDVASDVYGVARIGLSMDTDGRHVASGLALLFADGAPVAVRAQSAPVDDGDADFGVSQELVSPMAQWTTSFVSEDGRDGFTLELSATSTAAMLDAGHPAAELGGMEGYEQLLQVQGEATVGGSPRKIAGLGQRSHSWGSPDWDRISMARTLGAWFPDGAGATVSAIRKEGVPGHGEEAVGAFLITGGEPVAVGDPRLSTTYDGEGRQRQAGLELYVGEGEDEFAHRAAGEVVCGTTLDLGRLRLDSAFMRWRMDGRQGIGRYDVLRRVT